MSKRTAVAKTVLVCGLSWLVAPAMTQAATTVGQLSPSGMAGPCNTSGQPGELVQLLNATGNSYAVPAGGGVITSWSTAASGGVGAIRLRVYSSDSNATSITPVAESEPVEFAPDPAGAHPTRIPVEGGEHIGYSITATGGTGCAYVNNAPADVAVIAKGVGPLNAPKPIALPNGAAQSTLLLSIAASVEPDGDGDGFGDETQDACPSQATTQAACDNTFTFGKRKTDRKKGTATVEVALPGPGALALSGMNVASQSLVVDAVGNATLAVKPKGKSKRKLAKKGKLKIQVQIAYTPVGGEQGTQTTSVNLKKKQKK